MDTKKKTEVRRYPINDNRKRNKHAYSWPEFLEYFGGQYSESLNVVSQRWDEAIELPSIKEIDQEECVPCRKPFGINVTRDTLNEYIFCGKACHRNFCEQEDPTPCAPADEEPEEEKAEQCQGDDDESEVGQANQEYVPRKKSRGSRIP